MGCALRGRQVKGCMEMWQFHWKWYFTSGGFQCVWAW